MTALAEHLPPAFALLGEVLRTPAFREREVDATEGRARRGAAAAARGAARTRRRAVLALSLRRRVALRASRGRRRAKRRRDRARAAASSFYESRYLPGANDASSSRATSPPIAPRSSRVERFGDWERRRAGARGRERRSAGASTTRACTSSRRATRRSRSCGSVTSAFRAIIRTSFRSIVMNAMLGGLFNSRINLNLREAHAYTYGAFSAFDWRRQAGPFVVSTAVKSRHHRRRGARSAVRDRSHSRGSDLARTSCRSRRAISTACFRFASRRRRRSPRRSRCS